MDQFISKYTNLVSLESWIVQLKYSVIRSNFFTGEISPRRDNVGMRLISDRLGL